MASKRKTNDLMNNSPKRRKTISLKVKSEILIRLDKGEKLSDVARSFGVNPSTIATIKKDKARIENHIKTGASTNSTIISKNRDTYLEETEKLLRIWMDDMLEKKMPVSIFTIQTKARNLYKAIKIKTGPDCDTNKFSASNGWFDKFKKRSGYHNVKITGEASSCDEEGAKNFKVKLETIIKEGNYTEDQVFNVDETGLFWRKMPDRSYIAKQEKSLPGYKSAKERVSLLLGGNISGDYKLKPLILHRSQNPRALKNIPKTSLPFIYKWNTKAWVTLVVFDDWFKNYFIPEIKEYCRNKNIPFKILLLIDNAPGHPTDLDKYNENVKVVFLPPNTTPLIQPMDQGAIAAFKKIYLREAYQKAVHAVDIEKITLKEFWSKFNIYDAIKVMDTAWNEITKSCMNKVWKKLCPQYFKQSNSDDPTEDQEEDVIITQIVNLADRLEIQLEETDIHVLLDSHQQELSDEDLIELGEMDQENDTEEIEEEPKKFTVKKLEKVFGLLDELLDGLEEQDSNSERFLNVSSHVRNALSCYNLILREKSEAKKQSSIDKYFN